MSDIDEMIRRHSAPVPRYTSYPTAPHFTTGITSELYRQWLSELPSGEPISLYFHIPFCRQLCWYCGCSTKAVLRHEPVTIYLASLEAEIRNVAKAIPASTIVSHVHFGGGSPNILSPIDIERLNSAIRGAFTLAPDVEFAVEIDPRHLSDDQADAFARAGVNRISVGVQDFSNDVQEAINRQQSYEDTERAIRLFRDRGVRSINVDLVYGLPHQTRASLTRTIAQVLSLKPDRIAVFGYAHLPSRFSHQRLIKDEALPGPMERFGQSRRLSRVLQAAGYVQIGLDHYARAADTLASEPLRRNFQGYTSDSAETLLGLGATAIGKLPQGYVQNAVPTGDYMARIGKDGLATARGLAMSEDDRMRGYVIERLMCDLSFSRSALEARFGSASEPVVAEAQAIISDDPDGLVEETEDGFVVTERGRPFVRSICACFDGYLGRGHARHSAGV